MTDLSAEHRDYWTQSDRDPLRETLADTLRELESFARLRCYDCHKLGRIGCHHPDQGRCVDGHRIFRALALIDQQAKALEAAHEGIIDRGKNIILLRAKNVTLDMCENVAVNRSANVSIGDCMISHLTRNNVDHWRDNFYRSTRTTTEGEPNGD